MLRNRTVFAIGALRVLVHHSEAEDHATSSVRSTVSLAARVQEAASFNRYAFISGSLSLSASFAQ